MGTDSITELTNDRTSERTDNRTDNRTDDRTVQERHATQLQMTRLLDNQFPLRSGSHCDVESYLVYFDHLMAIQSDGSTTSLVTPSQFQCADGSLDGPTAIWLSTGDTDVQINLLNGRSRTRVAHPCIDRVHLKTVLSA